MESAYCIYLLPRLKVLKVNSQKCTHAYRCKRKVKATIIHYCVFFLFICSLRRVSLTCPKSACIGGLHSSIAPSLSLALFRFAHAKRQQQQEQQQKLHLRALKPKFSTQTSAGAELQQRSGSEQLVQVCWHFFSHWLLIFVYL